MTNEGELIFADSLILDLTGSSFDADNNFTLITGNGDANIDNWLTNNSSDLATHLLGIDTEGKTFSYANGVLSYTLGNIIDTNENESFTGTIAGEITFKDDTGTASLGEGFAQDSSSSFKGAGTIQVAAGADVVLSNASTEFTGTTALAAGSAGDATELTVGHAEAVGEGNLQLADHSSITIASGVVLDNDLTHERGNAQLLTGDLTVTGRSDGSTSYSSGATSAGNLVENVTLTNADVDLVESGAGSIRNTTLTNTAVTLGDGSELTLENVTIGLGTTITNSSATLRYAGNVEIEAATGNGMDAGRLVPDLDTLEGGTQEMLVYKLTAISVAENIIEGTLTLDITPSGLDLTAFENTYLTDGGIIAFELNGVSKDEYKTDYDLVTIILSDGTKELYRGAALGHTYVGDNVVFYIPEPSTATLSLLALAGMLLRRRRKDEA